MKVVFPEEQTNWRWIIRLSTLKHWPAHFAKSNEWSFATSKLCIKKQVTFFATRNERILLRVTSNFLQQRTSAASNGRTIQRVTSNFLQLVIPKTSNEQNLQRVMREFLQWVTSKFYKEWWVIFYNKRFLE